MMRLIIKIGGGFEKDLRRVFYKPVNAELGAHTLYLKNCSELYEILSPKRLELLLHIIKHQAEKKTGSSQQGCCIACKIQLNKKSQRKANGLPAVFIQIT